MFPVQPLRISKIHQQHYRNPFPKGSMCGTSLPTLHLPVQSPKHVGTNIPVPLDPNGFWYKMFLDPKTMKNEGFKPRIYGLWPLKKWRLGVPMVSMKSPLEWPDLTPQRAQGTTISASQVSGVKYAPFPARLGIWCVLQAVPEFETSTSSGLGWLPSRELTYPTWGKGKSSSKLTFQGTC